MALVCLCQLPFVVGVAGRGPFRNHGQLTVKFTETLAACRQLRLESVLSFQGKNKGQGHEAQADEPGQVLGEEGHRRNFSSADG